MLHSPACSADEAQRFIQLRFPSPRTRLLRCTSPHAVFTARYRHSKDCDGQVFVDNITIGDHRAGGYQPFWLDVPPSASATRTLLVVVDNRFNATTAPTTTGGDFYFYGGISRDVLVHELPQAVTIRQVETFTVDVGQALVDVNVVLHGAQLPATVQLSLSWNGHFSVPFTAPVVKGVATLRRVTVMGGEPWTLARPALNTLRVDLDGDAVEVRFGLRVVGVDAGSGRLTLNGAVTKLRGVNRHTMWPDTGNALTLEQVQADVALLKVCILFLLDYVF